MSEDISTEIMGNFFFFNLLLSIGSFLQFIVEHIIILKNVFFSTIKSFSKICFRYLFFINIMINFIRITSRNFNLDDIKEFI
jgi:hypothetical protein